MYVPICVHLFLYPYLYLCLDLDLDRSGYDIIITYVSQLSFPTLRPGF